MKKLKQKLIIIIILILGVVLVTQPTIYSMFQANIQYSHTTDFFLTYNRSKVLSICNIF